MIDFDSLRETHTWQYMLFVNPMNATGNGSIQSLRCICPTFTTNFCVDITEFDREDCERLKQFLMEHKLSYTIEAFLWPCD